MSMGYCVENGEMRRRQHDIIGFRFSLLGCRNAPRRRGSGACLRACSTRWFPWTPFSSNTSAKVDRPPRPDWPTVRRSLFLLLFFLFLFPFFRHRFLGRFCFVTALLVSGTSSPILSVGNLCGDVEKLPFAFPFDLTRVT